MKGQKISIKQYLVIAVPLMVVLILLIVTISIFVFNGSFRDIIINTNKGLVVTLIIITVIAFLFFLVIQTSNRTKEKLKTFINTLTIEKALVSLGIFESINDNIVKVPSIKIDSNEQKIYISLKSPLFRAKLENYSNVLSSALPTNWIIDNSYLTVGQDVLVIEYFDTTTNTQQFISNPEVYTKMQTALKTSQIQIMPNVILDLKKTPHILVTGTTNGGKSYFVLNNIIASALIKEWKVSILDYKSQYHILDGICNTAYTAEEILTELRKIKEEMATRKKVLESTLKSDFTAVAYEHGYPIHLVIIEEYTALLTSGLKKEVKNEIEEIVLNLAVLSRSLGFCLCLITQQSGSTVIPTSLRSQLQFRILLGSPSQSIYECTFEDKSKPNVNMSLPIGCGLYSNDGINIKLFRGFTFNYQINELLRLLSCKNQ